MNADVGTKGKSKNHLRAGIGKVESMDVDGGTKYRTKCLKDPSQDKSIKITLDSWAGVSCWPEKLWKSIPMNPKTKGVRFSAANGSELKYDGNKNVQFAPKDKVGKGGNRESGGVREMKFHVADATKPLASAMAVVKAGNKVVLDPEGSYIENKLTKERIKLIEVGGTFVFDIEPDQAMRAAGFARRR